VWFSADSKDTGTGAPCHTHGADVTEETASRDTACHKLDICKSFLNVSTEWDCLSQVVVDLY